MSFNVISVSLDNIKTQVMACNEQISVWLERSVRPVCERLLMRNPIIATVSVAAFAVFSLATIAYYHQKSKKLNESNLKNKTNKNQLDELQEAKKKLETEISFLKSTAQAMSKKSLDFIEKVGKDSQNKMNDLEENLASVSEKLRLATEEISKSQAEFLGKMNTLNLELSVAKEQNSLDKTKIDELEKKITEVAQEAFDLRSENQDLVFENDSLKAVIRDSAENLVGISDTYETQKAEIDQLTNEKNYLEKCLSEFAHKPVSQDQDLALTEMIHFKNLRKKDQDLIANKSTVFLTLRVLRSINEFITTLDELLAGVSNDPEMLFTISINRLDDWSDVEEVKNLTNANPFAKKVALDEEMVNFAGSGLNFMTNSVISGHKKINVENLNSLLSYYLRFKEALELEIARREDKSAKRLMELL